MSFTVQPSLIRRVYPPITLITTLVRLDESRAVHSTVTTVYFTSDDYIMPTNMSNCVSLQVSVSSTFEWMCSISYVISHVCYAVKFLDSLCEFFDFINESIFGAIRQREFSKRKKQNKTVGEKKTVYIVRDRVCSGLKSYVRHMKNMFYVSVKFKHSFSFESTPSKLSSDIIRGIITEIKYKIENVVLLFDWAGSVLSFFFLYVFVR